jgi:hypothetical protein
MPSSHSSGGIYPRAIAHKRLGHGQIQALLADIEAGGRSLIISVIGTQASAARAFMPARRRC